MEKKELFQTFTLKPSGAKLKNRIVMAPMTTWSGTPEGFLSARERDYYQARSKGPAMVISAACAIDLNAQAFTGQISARSDNFMPSLERLAKAIHSGGSKAILQIHHGGRMCPQGMQPDAEVVSASDIPAERPGAAQPRALSEEEVKQLIETHVEVTERAFRAGFDGVELHGANTYLLQQFFSPHSNRRNDHWGGSREKRMHLALEIINRVSEQIKSFKKPFILGYRFSPEEIETPGITLDDTRAFVDALCETTLDYLHISLPHYNATSLRNTEDPTPVASSILQSIAGRKPLIGVGRIQNQDDADDALGLGYELVAVGSSLIANPDWVEKVRNEDELDTELYQLDCDIKHVPDTMFETLYKLNKARGNWPGIAIRK